MHRGCFTLTPTLFISGRRRQCTCPLRVCVCVPLLAGSRAPASRARFDAPHFLLWPVLVLSLSGRPPPGWGCPASGCSCVLFLLCALAVSGVPCFPAPGALVLGVWCPPPVFFLLPPSLPPRVFFSACLLLSLYLGSFFSPPFFSLFFLCRDVLFVRCSGCLCVLGRRACWCALLL